jgi:hypothetical protein
LCCRAVGKKANGILVADAVTLCVAVLLCLAAPAAQAESWANNRGGAVKPYTGAIFPNLASAGSFNNTPRVPLSLVLLSLILLIVIAAVVAWSSCSEFEINSRE